MSADQSCCNVAPSSTRLVQHKNNTVTPPVCGIVSMSRHYNSRVIISLIRHWVTSRGRSQFSNTWEYVCIRYIVTSVADWLLPQDVTGDTYQRRGGHAWLESMNCSADFTTEKPVWPGWKASVCCTSKSTIGHADSPQNCALLHKVTEEI